LDFSGIRNYELRCARGRIAAVRPRDCNDVENHFVHLTSPHLTSTPLSLICGGVPNIIFYLQWRRWRPSHPDNDARRRIAAARPRDCNDVENHSVHLTSPHLTSTPLSLICGGVPNIIFYLQSRRWRHSHPDNDVGGGPATQTKTSATQPPRQRRRAVRDWGAPLMESQPVPAAL